VGGGKGGGRERKESHYGCNAVVEKDKSMPRG
jgi:hypothetical protein